MLKTTAREVVRDVLHTTSLDRMLMKRRRARGQDIGHLQHRDRSQVFSYIYDHAVWRNGADEGSLSGAGSEVDATQTVRREIADTLDRLNVKSVLDVGCGDFNWMKHVDLGTVDYLGVDIVRTVMDENQRLYGSDRRRFLTLDAVTDQLPRADLVLCREVLFHLSLADGRSLLDNIKRSGAKYAMITSDTATSFNADIKTGDFRILNLLKRPFHLPGPTGPALTDAGPQTHGLIRWLPDAAVSPSRGLGVWPAAVL